MPTPLRLRVFLALALALACSPARAEGGGLAVDDDPFGTLREGRLVSGASKRPQPLSEAPSSVSVLTAAQIKAHGFQTLAEALAWVRGLYVVNDRNYSYIGVRGLQRPGDYNNKVLLTLDGHAMNGDVYGDAPFGSELGLDLEAVERIEVVRGPGSALYGSNAVLAVVNVVTLAERADDGPHASLRAGSADDLRMHADGRFAPPRGPEWNVHASWRGARGADLRFPEFESGPAGGLVRGEDGERSANLFATGRWSTGHIALKLGSREKDVPTAPYGTTFAAGALRTVDQRDFVEVANRWQPAANAELEQRAYWDAARYEGDFPYGPPDALTLNHDVGNGYAAGTESRLSLAPAPGQALTVGSELRWAYRAHQSNYDLGAAAPYFDDIAREGQVSGYAQHEARLPAGVRATLGARLDGRSGSPAVWSPRVDLAWQAGPATRWKLLAGSAYRAPSVFERRYRAAGELPNPDLRPERVASVEAGVDHERGPVRATLTLYRNQVRDLVELAVVNPAGDLQYRNRCRVTGQGAEGEIEWSPRSASRVTLDAAWQTSRDVDSGAELTNAPRWNARLLGEHAPAGGRWTLGLGARYLSPRVTRLGARTRAAFVTDARLARRLAPGVEAAVEGRNLFDERYADPVSDEYAQDAIAQDGRRVFASLSLGGGRR